MNVPEDYDDKVERSGAKWKEVEGSGSKWKELEGSGRKWEEVELINTHPEVLSEEEQITSSSEVLRNITKNMINERDSHHIYHKNVLDKSKFINIWTLEHTGRWEPLRINKDKRQNKH